MIMNRVVHEKHQGKGQHDSNYIFLPLKSSNEGDKTYTVKWEEIQRELRGNRVATIQKLILLEHMREERWCGTEVLEEVKPWTGNNPSY